MTGINRWVWMLAASIVFCAVLEGLLNGRVVWFVQLMGLLTIFGPITIAVAGLHSGRQRNKPVTNVESAPTSVRY